jgi:hypothetical protein
MTLRLGSGDENGAHGKEEGGPHMNGPSGEGDRSRRSSEQMDRLSGRSKGLDGQDGRGRIQL